MFSTKRMRRAIAVLMSVCICLCYCTPDANAAELNSQTIVSSEQLSSLIDNVEDVIEQLQSMGLSEEQIQKLISVDDENYVAGDSASNVIDSRTVSNQALYSDSQESAKSERKNRLVNIYSIALQYYESNYYQGTESNSDEKLKNYLKYLYVSYYIDGPDDSGVSEDDLPYIISTTDIRQFDSFLSGAKGADYINNAVGFISDVISIASYPTYLNETSKAGQNIKNTIIQAVAGAPVEYSIYDATDIISSKIVECLDNRASQGSSFTDSDVINDVLVDLEGLNFYDEYDENYTKNLVSTYATLLIDIATNPNLKIIDMFLGYVPLLVYNYSTFFEVARITALRYSFSARLAIRTDIYIENEL